MNLKDLNIDKTWTLFLDRDGVINKRIEDGYVTKWEEFIFLPKVIDALKILSNFFGRIIIITNQRGISRGFMTDNDLEIIHNNMINELKKYNIYINDIFYCPHDIIDNCECRKPKIGLINQALNKYNDIDLKKSIMIGDSETDVLLGKNAGIITIHVGEESIKVQPDFYFNDLYEFSKELILIKRVTI